jgi:hypothetical protein
MLSTSDKRKALNSAGWDTSKMSDEQVQAHQEQEQQQPTEEAPAGGMTGMLATLQVMRNPEAYVLHQLGVTPEQLAVLEIVGELAELL